MLAHTFSFDNPSYLENLPNEILAEIINAANLQSVLNLAQSSKNLHDKIWDLMSHSYESSLIFMAKIFNYSMTERVHIDKFPQLLENFRKTKVFKQLKEKVHKSSFELLVFALITDDIRELPLDQLKIAINKYCESPFFIWLNPKLLQLINATDLALNSNKNNDAFGFELFLLALKKINFRGLNLNGADFSKRAWDGVNLVRANLCNAILANNSLESTSLNGTLLKASNFNHALIRTCKLIYCDLTDSNLEESTISYSDLSRANLIKANLKKVHIFECLLCKTNLHNADLTQACIGNSNLTNANLSGANLCNTVFKNCDLTGANLCDSNLLDIKIEECILKNVKFIKFDLNNLFKAFEDKLTQLEEQLKNNLSKDVLKQAIILDIRNQLTYLLSNQFINHDTAIKLYDQAINHDFFQGILYKFTNTFSTFFCSSYQKVLIEFKKKLMQQSEQKMEYVTIQNL